MAQMPRRWAGHRFCRASRDLPHSRQREPEGSVSRKNPWKEPKLRTLGALRHHLSPPPDISVCWAALSPRTEREQRAEKSPTIDLCIPLLILP